MALEVKVEWKHINNCEPDSTTMCPIARALREQHPLGITWCVWIDRAAVWPGRVYWLPAKAVRFIVDLMEGKPVLPFTFMLEE